MRTACTYDCPDACTLLVEALPGGGFRVRGDPESPFTRGAVCAKVRRHLRRLSHESRLLAPRLKTDRGWREIAWEEALDRAAAAIQALRGEPASILHIAGDGAKGVLKEAVNLLFAELGTRRTRGSLCDAAGYVATVTDFGARENNDIEELGRARAIVLWGKDLQRSSLHTAALVHRARRGGAAVVSISPHGGENRPFADHRIRLRPGTDRFLAAAVLRRLADEGAIPPERFACTRGAEAFHRVLLSRTAEAWLSACEVPGAEAERLARLYREGGPVATLIGAGLQRYRRGGETVRWIDALAVLSGNIGRPGAGVYFHLHSFHNLELGWVRGSTAGRRPALPIADIGGAILAANPPVRLLWVNGSNVVNQAPDSGKTAEAFSRVGFKVVVDAFPTDTAERADLVLPCTLLFEQEDVVGSFLHEYVQPVRRVVEPPAGVRDDYWIVREIGRRLSPPVLLPEPEDCLRAALRSPWLETSLEELRARGFVRSLRPGIAFEGMRFAHPDGKCRLPSAIHDEEPAPPGFPLRLLSLVHGRAIHSQILPEDQLLPPAAGIAPDSPGLSGIDRDRPVALVSPLGRMRVRLRMLPGLHPEAVLVRRGTWMRLGGGVNRLVAATLTDLGAGAAFYAQFVRLEND